jgi:hypothetical protein
MTNDSVGQRLLQGGGSLADRNGVMGLLRPRWHTLPWRGGPQLALAMSEQLADNPKISRPVYLAQAAVGVALLTRSRLLLYGRVARRISRVGLVNFEIVPAGGSSARRAGAARE